MKVWGCPKCRWVVSDIEYMSIIADVRCGGCDQTHFSDFHSVEWSDGEDKATPSAVGDEHREGGDTA